MAYGIEGRCSRGNTQGAECSYAAFVQPGFVDLCESYPRVRANSYMPSEIADRPFAPRANGGG